MTLTTTYEFTATCRCPVDPAVVDVYRVTVTCVDEMLPVEQILEVANRLAQGAPLFQEDYTEVLGEQLGGAQVTTRGVHSGVETTCSC